MKNFSHVFWTLTVLLLVSWDVPQVHADVIGMVTGEREGTYIRFGQDIANIAQQIPLEILVKPSEGSVENIIRIMSKENAALGIVQADVLEEINRHAESAPIHPVEQKLGVIFPLYPEEVHLLATKDIHYFEQLRTKRVVVGVKNSGTWLTAHYLLHLLLKVEDVILLELPPSEGLDAILRGDADAMFYVTGAPAMIFTTDELKKTSRYSAIVQGFHFLPIPLSHEKIREKYTSASIGRSHYEWLTDEVFTISVYAMLVGFDFSTNRSEYSRRRCTQREHSTLLTLSAVVVDSV